METVKIPIVIVAAMSRKNRGIGYKNKLLWHIPADLQRFKQLTLGQPIIMGRKTFESIVAMLGKPLPGRTTIVLTRNQHYKYPDVITVTSLKEAITVAANQGPTEIHIGGGAELYQEALPFVDRLHLTLVESEAYADTFFPEFEEDFIATKEYEWAQSGNMSYQFVDFERKEN